MLLFLVLSVNSTRFGILHTHSYSSCHSCYGVMLRIFTHTHTHTHTGTWRTKLVASATRFTRISQDIPVQTAATLSVNPTTAYRMLKDFVKLKTGTVDREIFMLKIIHVKNFRVDKFLQFHSILEIFLRKMFYLHVKFSRLVSTAKLF